MFYKDNILNESIFDKLKTSYQKRKNFNKKDPNDWKLIESYRDLVNKYMDKINRKIIQSLKNELKKAPESSQLGIEIEIDQEVDSGGLSYHNNWFEYIDFWNTYNKLKKIIKNNIPNEFKIDDGGDWDGGSVYICIPISWIEENLM